MFHFTKDERLVLFVFSVVIFSGTTLNMAYKKYPHLKNIVHLMQTNILYSKLDLNQATAQELIKIPYIGEMTAKNIVEYRYQHGSFEVLEDLKKVKGIRDKNFEKFKDYLKINKN